MNSRPIFSRGSTQVLGNMPFQSELATGSALHETDVRLDEIALGMSGLLSHVNEIDSTRPTRTEIHGISGNYATHGEVREWAEYASGGAVTYATSAIAEASGSLANEIDQLETDYVEADTVVLSGAEKYARDLVSDTSAVLSADYSSRFITEENVRKSAVASEHDRASGEEYRIKNTFNDWCTTISGNLDMSAKLLSDEDIRINGRIDTYQQTFSAVLDDVSATAKDALKENDFHAFIDSAGVQYSEDTKTMYLGRGVGEKVSLSANGDITLRNAKAEEVQAGSVICAGLANANALFVGSGECILNYNGKDTFYFGDIFKPAGMEVFMGKNIRYKLYPAISYMNGQVEIGKPIQNVAPVSMILVGGATGGSSSHENCVVISPPTNPNATGWWPKGSGTITMYTTANPVESGIYIGASTLPEIITKYAASKDDLTREVLTEIQNVSGDIGTEIHNDLWQETNQLVSGAISTSEQNLSAYVNTETQRRIDDVQSVRDELPNYLPVMGGTILGDLTASAFNVFDAFSGAPGQYTLYPNDNYHISGVEIRATLLTPMTVLEKRIASGFPADSVDLKLDVTGVVYHEDPETHVRTISGDYHYNDTLECQYVSTAKEYRHEKGPGVVNTNFNLKSVFISIYPLTVDSYAFYLDGIYNFCGPVSIVQYVDERVEAIATAASTLQEVAEYLKSINEGD